MGQSWRLLVFQHIECEHPGSLRDGLQADGVDWTVVELNAGEAIPPLADFDALWVMGGPMDVWDVGEHPWLVDEKEAIRRWVRELERPFLGLSLGHQLLAEALGGACGTLPSPEIGVIEVELTTEGRADPVFEGMADRQEVLQWHSVQVVEPPQDAVVLAQSPMCSNQAMRVGPRAWSMQYHVEVEPDTVRNWGAVPAYRQALEAAVGPGALDQMAAAADRNAWKNSPLPPTSSIATSPPPRVSRPPRVGGQGGRGSQRLGWRWLPGGPCRRPGPRLPPRAHRLGRGRSPA